MKGRGGCCIRSYTGASTTSYNASRLDRLMLRFRPIAPKPVSGSADTAGAGAKHNAVKTGRRKRRCNHNGNKRRRKTSEGNEKANAVKSSVTLPLLPESPDLGPTNRKSNGKNVPVWIDFKEGQIVTRMPVAPPDPTDFILPRHTDRLVGTRVVVECITDTWINGEGIGRTEVDRKMRFESDTCPAFISDGGNRVWWANEAFRKMMTWQEGRMMTWLVMKERAPVTCRGFTCRVRVQRSYGGEEIRRSSSLTVPCDTWRMESGGFAWRLDVKAALCLGR